MINSSSVVQYTNKSYKNAFKTQFYSLNAIMMEQIISHELGAGSNGMVRIIPKIRKLIAPIITIVFCLQDKEGDVNIKVVQKIDVNSTVRHPFLFCILYYRR